MPRMKNAGLFGARLFKGVCIRLNVCAGELRFPRSSVMVKMLSAHARNAPRIECRAALRPAGGWQQATGEVRARELQCPLSRLNPRPALRSTAEAFRGLKLMGFYSARQRGISRRTLVVLSISPFNSFLLKLTWKNCLWNLAHGSAALSSSAIRSLLTSAMCSRHA